jgi:2-polyprenyl-3-methyl-5-hydroxy-6-metoxy-1,4-benzoquinol methylase
MRPAPRQDLDGPAGNVYDKYGSRNPVVRRLMAGFDTGMFELLAHIPTPKQVLEVGCGEGHVTAKLAKFYPGARIVGTDRSPEIIARARDLHHGLEFRVMPIADAGTSGPWDLVVACEVFEHLADPVGALDAVCRAAHGHVLVTVPREPLWRVMNVARGRYWGALGNTPGHVQHWSRGALLRFLRTRLAIVDTRSPVPWTQVLGRPLSAPRT